MHVERLALAALLWLLVACGLYLVRGRSPLHLPTIALLTTGLVGSFFPVASLFIEPSSWRNLDYLSPAIVAATQLEYIAFAAGLLLATLATARSSVRREASPPPAPERTAQRDFALAFALVTVGLALYALYVQRVGLRALFDHDDYAVKYLLGRGLGPLQFGLAMAIAGCLWAEAAPLPLNRKGMFRLVAGAIGVWSLAFVSVRTDAVVLALGYAAIVCERRGFALRRVRVSLVALFLGLYLVLESFALFRGTGTGDVGQALSIIRGQAESALASALGGSELSHPFVTTAEVLRGREGAELCGASLVDGVLACLPRGIWPQRPLLLSEQFVRSNYADLAARGGGAAFSLVAEAWLNFGSIVGPLIFGLVLGTLLAAVERRRARAPHGIVARLAPYFVFYVAMEHRNEFGTLFKQTLIMTLVVLSLWLLADAASTGSSRRASLAPLRR